nr:hypothetical protein [Nocardioides marmorisolisilvae]
MAVRLALLPGRSGLIVVMVSFDVDHHPLAEGCSDQRLGGQAGQEPGRDRVEVTYVAEGERPEE